MIKIMKADFSIFDITNNKFDKRPEDFNFDVESIYQRL